MEANPAPALSQQYHLGRRSGLCFKPAFQPILLGNSQFDRRLTRRFIYHLQKFRIYSSRVLRGSQHSISDDRNLLRGALEKVTRSSLADDRQNLAAVEHPDAA